MFIHLKAWPCLTGIKNSYLYACYLSVHLSTVICVPATYLCTYLQLSTCVSVIYLCTCLQLSTWKPVPYLRTYLWDTYLTNFATLLTVDRETFWLLTLMMKSPAFSPASSAGEAVDAMKINNNHIFFHAKQYITPHIPPFCSKLNQFALLSNEY